MVKVDNALLVVQTRGDEILCCIIVTDKSRHPLSHQIALICSVHRARKHARFDRTLTRTSCYAGRNLAMGFYR